jgi:hypothetical protein
MKGKASTLLVLALVLTSVFMTAVIVKAKPLSCTMDLIKLPLGPPHPEWGPNTWSGTISGDIDGNIYFYKTAGKIVGQARHFWEVWLITDDEDNMLLMGTDKGVVSSKNGKFRMSGVVTDAVPQFEYLIGRNVYMCGEIIPLTAPPEADGIFRVD